MKEGAHLSMTIGELFLKLDGYGDRDGAGRFQFMDGKLGYEDYDDRDGAVRFIEISRSELLELQQFLNKYLRGTGSEPPVRIASESPKENTDESIA